MHAVHARGQLSRRSRVWVLSDGFDADEPERLAEELALVRLRGVRITWFHPSERAPASAAMQAVRAFDGANAGAALVERYLRLDSLRDLTAVAGQLH